MAGGLSLGTTLTTRELISFTDGSSNIDNTKYITDHYLTSESDLGVIIGYIRCP